MAEKLLIALLVLSIGYMITILLEMRMDAYNKRCDELVDKDEIDFIVGRVMES